jgi:cation diffusion facilitator family transporter
MENQMPDEHIGQWQHQHTFNADKQHIESRTRIVVIITFVMMIAEIFFGWITHSMALFADGIHMGTHAFALGIALVAYMLARRQASNENFNFGTWKIEILGAYSSALVLGLVAIMMIYTSIERLIHPLVILYDQALLVASLGLLVNLVCAIILNSGLHSAVHHSHQAAEDVHDRKPGALHNDLNLKSAYLHVLADVLTSVFAIIAILGAKYLAFNRLDPIMGIAGAILIIRWAALLLNDSARILLDYKSPLSAEIRKRIESDGDSKISDLHVWKIADNNYACIISVVTGKNYLVDDYKNRLRNIPELAHITIEKNDFATLI